MADLIVRRYRDADSEAFGHVRAMTYRGGAPVGPEEKILREDCLGYVGELGGSIVAACTVLRMTCNIDGTQLPCAGIAAVAVNPEERGGGIGSQLMAKSQELIREDGFAVASLYPFREPFYRKSEFATCGARIHIKVPVHRLANLKETVSVRHLDHAKWPCIRSCADTFYARYNGSNVRGDVQWWRNMGGDTPFAIYAAGDPVEAFALVRLDGDFWVAQEIKEICWTTRRGYESLLSFLRGLCINKDSLSWHEPSDGPYVSQYLDQGVILTNQKLLMYRALDIESVLRARKFEGDGRFVVTIKGHGSWAVSYGPGGTDVAQTGDTGIEISLGTFTQVALGQPSYAAMSVDGWLPTNGDAARFFGPRRVYNGDFF